MSRHWIRDKARRAGSSARSLIWTGGDQVLSSVSNVVIALAVARGGGSQALGVYALAFSGLLIVWGFQRALVLDPLLALLPRRPRAKMGRVAANAAGSSLLLLIPTGVAVSLVGVFARQPIILVLGPVIVATGIQDAYRYFFFSRKEPRRALLIDAARALVSFASWQVIVSTGSPMVAILVLGIGATAGMVVGRFMSSGWPASPILSLRWWIQEARPLGGFLALDSLVFTITTQAAFFALVVLVGTDGLGRLRAVQILLGPAALALVAVHLFTLPRIAEQVEEVSARLVAGISGLSVGLVLLVTTLIWLVGPSLIQLVYGADFAGSASLVIPVGAAIALSASAIGPGVVLKARLKGPAILKAGVLAGIGTLGAVVVGGLLGGLLAAAWGFALGAAISSGVLWRSCSTLGLLRSVRLDRES